MSGAPHETLLVKTMVTPEDWGTGAVTSAAVDTKGFEEALIVLSVGTAGASAGIDILVQESDASTTGFTNISGTTFTQVTTSNDETEFVGRIRLGGRDRYLRVLGTVTTATSELAVICILTGGQREPVTQSNTVAFNITA